MRGLLCEDLGPGSRPLKSACGDTQKNSASATRVLPKSEWFLTLEAYVHR